MPKRKAPAAPAQALGASRGNKRIKECRPSRREKETSRRCGGEGWEGWEDAIVLELRRFEDADAAAVRQLHELALAGAGSHLGNGTSEDDLKSISASYLEDGGEFIVGLVDGRLVAMGALRHVTASVAELRRMRVHPGFHRRGFGRLILATLEDRARQLRYVRLRLDTTVLQTAAQQLCESAGYREVGRGQLAGTEVVYYEKRLM